MPETKPAHPPTRPPALLGWIFLIVIVVVCANALHPTADQSGTSVQPVSSTPSTSQDTSAPPPLTAEQKHEQRLVAKPRPAHTVIYKKNEYLYKPGWMTEKQWDSYIDFEFKHINDEAPPTTSEPTTSDNSAVQTAPTLQDDYINIQVGDSRAHVVELIGRPPDLVFQSTGMNGFFRGSAGLDGATILQYHDEMLPDGTMPLLDIGLRDDVVAKVIYSNGGIETLQTK